MAHNSYSTDPEVLVSREDKQVVSTSDRHLLAPEPGTHISQTRGYTAQEHRTGRSICGCSVAVFGTIAALVALLIAAAVGGGVGGALSVKSCNNDLQTCQSALQNASSASSRNNTNPTSTTVIPATGCNGGTLSSSDSTYTSIQGFVFTKVCEHNYIGSDIIGVVSATWELCLEACGTYNQYRNSSNPTVCRGVTFVPSWIIERNAVGNISFWSNCFLKYAIPTLRSAINTTPFEIVVGSLNTAAG